MRAQFHKYYLEAKKFKEFLKEDNEVVNSFQARTDH